MPDNRIFDISPWAFFNSAGYFYEAAQILHSAKEANASHGLVDPSYLLYFHSVELALKSFLLAEGISAMDLKSRKYGHDVALLLEECRAKGLAISPADEMDLLNVVNCLASGNEYEGFRYFHLKGTVRPGFNLTRRIVGVLIAAVRPRIEQVPQGDPNEVVKIDLTLDD